MSVAWEDRERWHRRNKVTKNGVDFWEYKYIDIYGSTTKRRLSTEDRGSQVVDPTSYTGYYDSSLDLAPGLDSGYSWESAFRDHRIRTHFFDNAENGDKLKDWFLTYGNKGELPTAQELKNIKENSTAEEWKGFLQYGVGVKEDNLDYYISGEGKFDEASDMSLEEIEEWIKPEDTSSWFKENQEGDIKVLKEEQDIQTSTDPRIAQLNEWASGDNPRINQDQYELFMKRLTGSESGETISDTSVIGKEIKAREDYRESLTGEEGYNETLNDLIRAKEEDMQSLNIDKDTSLDQILDNYMKESDEYQDAFGKQVSDIKLQEDIMKSKTGLSRDEMSISDLAKTYEEDYIDKIDKYRQETGKTQEEAMEDVRQTETTFQTEKDTARSSLDFSLQNIYDELGGGSTGASSFLTELQAGYWDDLYKDVDAIDDEHIASTIIGQNW